jgi:PQQ-like domain
MKIFLIKNILLVAVTTTTSLANASIWPACLAVCNNADTSQPLSASPLPGKGLQQHDFLYTGEWDHRKPVQTVFLVRNGKLVWSYPVPFKDSMANMVELGDAAMRSNGNIVFCTKIGAVEITMAKKIIWNYDAPKGTEIHVVQPVGIDRIFFVINGVPAIARIVNIKTGKTEKEFNLPTGKPGPHLQFRRVRLLESGNILAAHLDDDKVVEYDSAGKVTWSYAVLKPWSASRLKNGNTLITSSEHHVREVNATGEVVWELDTDSIAGIPLYQIQGAERLGNGNTVFCNWCPKAIKNGNDWPGTVQLLEVGPDKKLVWALSEWKNPDLGPASSIQILDKK